MHQAQRVSAGGRRVPPASAALARIGALALLLAAVAVLGYELGWFEIKHTLEHVSRLRASYGVAVFGIGFVLVFGVGAALGVPGLPLTAIAGLLFGTLLGSALAWAGGMIGAAGGYWLARTVGRDVVARWLKRFKRADRAVADSRDFGGMLRLRLIPILPLGITNFVGGLACAPFGPYMAAAAIGIIPATVIYAYFADSFLEGVGHGSTSARVGLAVASVLMIALSFAPRLFQVDAPESADAALGDPKPVTSGVDRHVTNH